MPNDKSKGSLSNWQPQAGAPLVPLAAPVNMASERAASSQPTSAPAPAPRGVGLTVVVAAVSGAVAAAAMHAVWPVVVPSPIVINVGQAAAAAPVAVAVPAVAPSAAPAVPAASPVKPAAAAAPVKPGETPKPGAPEDKKPTVGDAFAKLAAEPPPVDELTQAEINDVVKAHKGKTEACAEAQRGAAPDTSGSLVVRWNVETTGRVNSVAPSGELADSPFGQCLAKEIASWTFPAHEAPHPPVEATFKF